MKINQYVLNNSVSDLEYFVDCAYNFGLHHALAEYAARLCYRSTASCGTVPNFLKKKILDVNHFDVLEHGGMSFVMSEALFREFMINIPQARFTSSELHPAGRKVFMNNRVVYELMSRFPIVSMRDMTEENFPVIAGLDANAHEFYLDDFVGNNIPSIETNNATVTLLAYDDSMQKTGRATWLIEGVSLNMTHQLVRHRVFSFSQESKRYVDENKGDWNLIVPPEIGFHNSIDMRKHYQESVALYHDLRANGVKKEDARFVLPTGTETRLVVSAPWEGLEHFFKLRTVKAAQWEIRNVAISMEVQLKQALG
jgi:thymidylate synthase (FAD)